MKQWWSFRLSKDVDPWFRPELRTRVYDSFGDAYSDDKYRDICKQWVLEPSAGKITRPYLAFVKQIQDKWLHLRLLADFMQVGTHPLRWPSIKTPLDVDGKIGEKRKARLEKIKVCRLDYLNTGAVKPENFISSDSNGESTAAEKLAEDLDLTKIDPAVKFRLYVVEDLSSDVIEILGGKLDIEPSFFRAHIVDYVWYNVRDRWRDPPNLNVVSRHQNWVQLRYVTAKYFETRQKFDQATKEAEEFNIQRRIDNDSNNNSWWDDSNAIVGLTRARATFWLKPGHTEGETTIGVLLLDPTTTSGDPLWRGRRNWMQTPSPNSKPSEWNLNTPKSTNFYDDFLFWAQKPEIFSTPSDHWHSGIYHVPMQVLLHLACSEWRTMSDYIKTRLSQIDLENFKPKYFVSSEHADNVLDRLNIWRRFIPLYQEMVAETLEQIFNFPCHSEVSLTPHAGVHGKKPQGQEDPTGPKSPVKSSLGPINAYKNEFLMILSYLEGSQNRIDRLTTIVTTTMQIEDSRRGRRDAQNIGRLTWLATFFIPFSFIASAFSMQADVSVISGTTVKYYFATAIPMAIATVLIAWYVSHVMGRSVHGR